MGQFLFYAAAFIVALGLLVVAHELGHFLVARWCGVKILRFSVGFGPVLWQRRFGVDQTQWALSAIPLGGYVKMLDEREAEVAEHEAARAFNRQTVGKRSLIVVAGPLANFLLAIFLYWGVFMLGSDELRPILGTPPIDTPAAEAGILAGEEVRKVDGEAVASWSDLRWILLHKATQQPSVELEVVNAQGEQRLRYLMLERAGEEAWEGDVLARLGVQFHGPDLPPVIGAVDADTPGARAGLQSGDRILAVDGRPVANWYQFVQIVRKAPGQQLKLDLERQRRHFVVAVTPEEVNERGLRFGRIGVAVAPGGDGRNLRTFVRYAPLAAASKALRETWEKSWFTLTMMGKMLLGEVSWKTLSGPVTIADYAGQSARLGLDYYVKFMALISISLGVLNLLPIPVLDGGHLVYHAAEVIRGKPLSMRVVALTQQIGMAMLFALMAFALFNDFTRLFGDS
ncbi:RIP metalloprotease RseP [Azonexus sp.]|uniref:RIP metalloprotease RseP n=1 Tax=Azonexus sp. TaxID=1872668 RepID=UPI0039E414F3